MQLTCAWTERTPYRNQTSAMAMTRKGFRVVVVVVILDKNMVGVRRCLCLHNGLLIRFRLFVLAQFLLLSGIQ
jgi:hypothetical protein